MPIFRRRNTEDDYAVTSTEELAEVLSDWVGSRGFLRLSVTDGDHVMAEMLDGSYWVVGYITDVMDLPTFVYPR